MNESRSRFIIKRTDLPETTTAVLFLHHIPRSSYSLSWMLALAPCWRLLHVGSCSMLALAACLEVYAPARGPLLLPM